MKNSEALERAKIADDEYARLAYEFGNIAPETESASIDSEAAWKELEIRRAVKRYHVSRDRATDILAEQGIF